MRDAALKQIYIDVELLVTLLARRNSMQRPHKLYPNGPINRIEVLIDMSQIIVDELISRWNPGKYW
jgi:hypothetical protein